jgi:hypothetical protein
MNTGTIIGIVGGIIGVILLNGVYNSVSNKKTINASPIKNNPIIKILNSNSIKSSDGQFFDVSFGGKRKNKTKKY